MKLKHWIRFILYRDSTWQGQFSALAPLLLSIKGMERTVVDIGANDGFFSSNSYPFIARGWKAILVEPHPQAFAKAKHLHRKRSKVTLLNAGCSDQEGDLELNTYADDDGGSHSFLGENGCRGEDSARILGHSHQVKVHRLDSLMKQFQIAPDFGLLTIDTEGHDFKVLRGIDLSQHGPRVIITEKNPDDGEKFSYLQANGYSLNRVLEYDTIWTRN